MLVQYYFLMMAISFPYGSPGFWYLSERRSLDPTEGSRGETLEWGQIWVIHTLCSVHLSMNVRLAPEAGKGLSAAQVIALRSRFGGSLPLSPATRRSRPQTTNSISMARSPASENRRV